MRAWQWKERWGKICFNYQVEEFIWYEMRKKMKCRSWMCRNRPFNLEQIIMRNYWSNGREFEFSWCPFVLSFVELEFVRDEDILRLHGRKRKTFRNKKEHMKRMGKEDGEIKLCGWHVSQKKLRKGISWAWWVKELYNSKRRRRKRGRKLNI